MKEHNWDCGRGSGEEGCEVDGVSVAIVFDGMFEVREGVDGVFNFSPASIVSRWSNRE